MSVEAAVRSAPATPAPTRKIMRERSASAYVAELIGTFFLVFVICAFLSLTSVSNPPLFSLESLGLIHAFVLAMLIYTLGASSGAHFNPAVTTALIMLRKIRPADGLIYIAAQLAGGIAGALICKAILLDEGAAVRYGATAVSDPLLQGSALGGLACELIGTFVLMWAIMGMAVNPLGERAFGGLVIGMTLGVAVMIFGPLTGAGFNPARSLGPALASGSFGDFWIYIVGPVAGAILAALAYVAIVMGNGRMQTVPGSPPRRQRTAN